MIGIRDRLAAFPVPSGAAWLPALSLLSMAASLIAIRAIERHPDTGADNLLPYYQTLLSQDFWAGALGIAGILAALLVSRRFPADRLDRCLERIGRDPLPVAAFTFVGLGLAARVCYRAHPFIVDEYSVYLQAQFLAAGRIFGSFPPELIDWLFPDDFKFHFISLSEGGKAVSTYWPGMALLLTPFMKLGVPWLLNPLLAALSLCLTGYLARELLQSDRGAGWAVLLLLASPAFTVNAITYYSMTAHLTLNLAFTALLLGDSVRRRIAAGAVGSLALVLHNPLPHLLFALPWILWLALRPGGVRKLLALAAGYLPLSVGLGLGWLWIRHRLLQEGPVLPPGMDPVFRSAADVLSASASPTFGFPDAVTLGIRGVDTIKLLLWVLPGLPFLAWAGFRERNRPAPLTLLGLSALATFAGYFAVTYSPGAGWGYRYFHSALGAVSVLAAAAVVSRRAAGNLPWLGPALVFFLFAGTGLRLWQVRAYVSDHLDRLPCLEERVPHLCFVKDVDYGDGTTSRDFIHNDAFLSTPRIILLSQGDQMDRLIATRFFPGARHLEDKPEGSIWLREGGR